MKEVQNISKSEFRLYFWGNDLGIYDVWLRVTGIEDYETGIQ